MSDYNGYGMLNPEQPDNPPVSDNVTVYGLQVVINGEWLTGALSKVVTLNSSELRAWLDVLDALGERSKLRAQQPHPEKFDIPCIRISK